MSGTGWSFALHNAHLTVSEFWRTFRVMCVGWGFVQKKKEEGGKKKHRRIASNVVCYLSAATSLHLFRYEFVQGSIRRTPTFSWTQSKVLSRAKKVRRKVCREKIFVWDKFCLFVRCLNFLMDVVRAGVIRAGVAHASDRPILVHRLLYLNNYNLSMQIWSPLFC